MELLDLPVELLDQILDLTLPSGLESFALSCKAVYARAAAQILRHKTLKQQWRRTTFTNHHRGDLFRILYDISRDALAGQYVEVLDFLNAHHACEGCDEDFRVSKEVMQQIKTTVLDSALFEIACVDATEWWDAIAAQQKSGGPNGYGDVDAVHAFTSLMDQLPNLKTLQLPPGWYNAWSLDYDTDTETNLTAVFDVMIQASSIDDGRGRPLGKLGFLLPTEDVGHDDRAPFQRLEPFMGLKTLRELYATNCVACDDGYTGLPFEWRFPETRSSLRRVELTCCCMDADGISQLLSHTPLLVVFRYSHECKWHGCLFDWNAGEFAEAIAQHCGRSITDLAITCDTFYGDIVNGVSSFRRFSKLRQLEIELRVLCGPPLDSGQRNSEEDYVVPEGQIQWSVGDLPCWADMLPETIVETHINTDDFTEQDEAALEALLKDFPERRESRLSNLSQFMIRQYRDDSARALAKRAGAELLVFDQDGRQFPPREMMPAWRQRFHRRVEE
ncbi:hypothetical protein CC86DRAFT_312307, partial [Ophiobolus disseminans]